MKRNFCDCCNAAFSHSSTAEKNKLETLHWRLYLFVCCMIRPAGTRHFDWPFLPRWLSCQLLNLTMNIFPLFLATEEVLVNLHPMMCLPCADAVAMTTVTIGEVRNKRSFQKQLPPSGWVNPWLRRSCFAPYSSLFLFKWLFRMVYSVFEWLRQHEWGNERRSVELKWLWLFALVVSFVLFQWRLATSLMTKKEQSGPFTLLKNIEYITFTC